MLPGTQGISDGYTPSLDDGTTGAEVVHKATQGFVAWVNVTVRATAYVAGAVLEIRDGTGAANAKWRMTIPNLGVNNQQLAFDVPLSARFKNDIRTYCSVANQVTFTVVFY